MNGGEGCEWVMDGTCLPETAAGHPRSILTPLNSVVLITPWASQELTDEGAQGWLAVAGVWGEEVMLGGARSLWGDDNTRK